MTERPFSERIPKTTPSSGRLQCKVCRARGKRNHKLKYDVRYAKHLYIYTNVLRFTTLNFTTINPEMLLNIQTSLLFSGTISCTILFIYILYLSTADNKKPPTHTQS